MWWPLAAQALLSDWLGSKLRMELEMEEEDDLMCSAERRSPVPFANPKPAAINYTNFNGIKQEGKLYYHFQLN